MIKNEHKQTGGVVPRLLITAGLAPTTKGRHTQSQHLLAQVIILEYIRSGINLCFLYAILKRGTLVHSHRHTQTLLDLMKRERKKGKKAREDQAKAFVLILLFSFAFTLPSVFSSSFFQSAFHLFDRWATFVAIERDLEVCVITGSRMGTASRRGGGYCKDT